MVRNGNITNLDVTGTLLVTIGSHENDACYSSYQTIWRFFSNLLRIADEHNLRTLPVNNNAFALAATHARSSSQDLLSIPTSYKMSQGLLSIPASYMMSQGLLSIPTYYKMSQGLLSISASSKMSQGLLSIPASYKMSQGLLSILL
jgi:hypothetical protein